MGLCSPDSHGLPFHEKCVGALLIGIFFFLITLTFFNSLKPDAFDRSFHTSEPLILEVFIKGAVVHPGTYYLRAGATVEDLLNQAVPLETANLKRVRIAAVLKNQQRVSIPAKRQKTGKEKKLSEDIKEGNKEKSSRME